MIRGGGITGAAKHATTPNGGPWSALLSARVTVQQPGRRALAGLLACPALARAEAAPAATLLVGAAPGSAADLWTRGFAPFLERHWSRGSVAVANDPGEGGLAAARTIAAAAPDGRLIGAITTPLLPARAIAAGDPGLPGRLDWLASVAEEPVLLVAHPLLVPDLAALRGLGPDAVLGTPPAGSAAQLAAQALGRAMPLRLFGFATAAAARQAVVAGSIPCAMLGAPEAMGALREGRLVPLGQAQDRRSPLLPELPSLAELGLPGGPIGRRGFVLPPGLPGAPRAGLVRALEAAVADPEFVDQAEAGGRVPRFEGPAEWGALLRAERAALERRWVADPWVAR